MPTFVRVRDTSTGHEYDVAESSIAGLPREVVVLNDVEPVTGRVAQPRAADLHVDRELAAQVDPDMPAKSSNKPEWVAYAVNRGMDESTAESQTRDALIAHFTEES